MSLTGKDRELSSATISFVFVTPLSCARRGWPLFCENQLPGFTDFLMWPSAEGVQRCSKPKLSNIWQHKTVFFLTLDVWVWHFMALCGLQFAIERFIGKVWELGAIRSFPKLPRDLDPCRPSSTPYRMLSLDGGIVPLLPEEVGLGWLGNLPEQQIV